MNRFALGLLGIVALGWTGAAEAACAPGQDFDSCFFNQLGQMQQQNNNAIQQNYAAYMQAYGPQLEQAYQQWGYQSGATFDQFAYYMLMSANGTDIQGALQAQRQQFEGLQAAHRDQVDAGNIMIDSMQENSQRALNAVEDYGMGAVRGNVTVYGPDGPVELPYSDVQIGQQFDAGGYTYMMTQDGYVVWDGSNWQYLQ